MSCHQTRTREYSQLLRVKPVKILCNSRSITKESTFNEAFEVGLLVISKPQSSVICGTEKSLLFLRGDRKLDEVLSS